MKLATVINSSSENQNRTIAIRKNLVSRKTGPSGKSTKSRNLELNTASAAKKDEFYTQFEDVEKEVSNYPGAFVGKSVYCNCDDPFNSAFFRYFVLNFRKLGLRELKATSYAGTRMSGTNRRKGEPAGAYIAVVKKVPSGNLLDTDGNLAFEKIFRAKGNSISQLQGDGDFRSNECEELLIESDIVVTNPPFSLFREFISQLVRHGKKFVVLGNLNAVTYREVFPLFKNNRIWFGESIRSGDRKFYVPDDYPLTASNCGIDANGRRFIRVKGVRWFTNLNNNRRDESLPLTHEYSTTKYSYFDNYNAINVGRTLEIPADFQGNMGVPITFLDKYNPSQFEILMLANGNARTNVSKSTLNEVGYQADGADKGGVGILGGRRVYARILIRHRKS